MEILSLDIGRRTVNVIQTKEIKNLDVLRNGNSFYIVPDYAKKLENCNIKTKR